MKAYIAWCLSWLAEGIVLLCHLHDKVVDGIRAIWPSSKSFLKKKVFNIKGSTDNDRDTVYLKRYVVFQTKKRRLYIHRFLRSDYPVFHDHPWKGIFVHLRNTYTEEVLVKDARVTDALQVYARLQGKGWFQIVSKTRSLLDVTSIDQTHIHRVTLDKEYHNEPWKAPLTLAWCGERDKNSEGKDDWGFWVQAEYPEKWPGLKFYSREHWMDHLKVTQSNLDKKASH